MKQGKCINCGETYLSYTSRRKYCATCQDTLIRERSKKRMYEKRQKISQAKKMQVL